MYFLGIDSGKDLIERLMQIEATRREMVQKGTASIVGGCCGTTPEHIKAIGEAVANVAPRALPQDVSRAA